VGGPGVSFSKTVFPALMEIKGNDALIFQAISHYIPLYAKVQS
jgi:hypothetical protein